MHPEHWVEPTVHVDTHKVLVSALPYLASVVVHISCMYVYGMAGSSAFSLGAGDGASGGCRMFLIVLAMCPLRLVMFQSGLLV